MFLFALAIKLPGRFFRQCYCDPPKGTLHDSPCPTTDEVFDGCIIVRRHLRSVSIWPCCKRLQKQTRRRHPLQLGTLLTSQLTIRANQISNAPQSSVLEHFLDRVSQCGINKVHLIYSMLCKSPVCRLSNLEYNGSLSVYLLLYVYVFIPFLFLVCDDRETMHMAHFNAFMQ